MLWHPNSSISQTSICHHVTHDENTSLGCPNIILGCPNMILGWIRFWGATAAIKKITQPGLLSVPPTGCEPIPKLAPTDCKVGMPPQSQQVCAQSLKTCLLKELMMLFIFTYMCVQGKLPTTFYTDKFYISCLAYIHSW